LWVLLWNLSCYDFHYLIWAAIAAQL
jgi:hypothetical protein